MKAIAVILLLPLLARASEKEEKQRQCEWLVKVSNRCEERMRYSAANNLVQFDSLGTSAPCDDGKNLPFEERLRNSDVSSMLSQHYPIGPTTWPNTELNQSPGGIRNIDFVKAIYGSSQEEVAKLMEKVDFLGHTVPFHRRNGAAAALRRVGKELDALYAANSDPELTAFLKPFFTGNCTPASRCRVGGNTFVWRVVAGSNSPSNHSFGTAIDLQPPKGPEYWLWDVQTLIKEGKAKFREGADPRAKNPRDVIEFSPKKAQHVPAKLVEVFEKHGFIWGGKWYRYDVMHFEFRPEFFPDRTFPCK